MNEKCKKCKHYNKKEKECGLRYRVWNGQYTGQYELNIVCIHELKDMFTKK